MYLTLEKCCNVKKEKNFSLTVLKPLTWSVLSLYTLSIQGSFDVITYLHTSIFRKFPLCISLNKHGPLEYPASENMLKYYPDASCWSIWNDFLPPYCTIRPSQSVCSPCTQTILSWHLLQTLSERRVLYHQRLYELFTTCLLDGATGVWVSAHQSSEKGFFSQGC